MNAVLLDILGLGTREPGGHLAGKPLLCLAHTSIRHRLVHAGIGLNFGTVERHMAELDQPRRPTQLEHLHEQLAQSLQVPLSERGDGPEVRPVERGYRHEVDTLLACLGDLARGIDPAAISIEQKRHHHCRMVRRTAAFLLIHRKDCSKVQLLAHRIAHKMRKVIGSNQLMHRWWQQPSLLNVPRAKGFAHAAT